METKKEKNIDPEPRQENPDDEKTNESFTRIKGLFRKKFAVWIIAASAIFILGTAYLFFAFPETEQTEQGSFAGKFFKPFLAEDQSFLERNSFFFLPGRNESASSEKNGAETVLNEASKKEKSSSQDWWLNSGGIMNLGSGEFSTNLGPLSKDSRWRKLYSKSNPEDTDKGYYPQNIFRLVTRSKWDNFSQSVYFKIEKINLNQSENRNESNGILFFNRYQDGDNLYYAGIRVDGDAVIKKKINDKYYTLKEKEFFTNGQEYDKEKNPNLIPLNSWIGIKSEIKNVDGETVSIKLYIDSGEKGEWQLVLEAHDSQDKYGKEPFLEKGYAGIRTDFMDVRFKNYEILKI
ncbi:MAG: hypothetical protein A2Z52_00855 [Candidatus Moranbacteria bacterium RBG_19FT_COMBO_42_6]|nr:MAG: hypothetical protein A2Z52_00855 [Candidatus Moranbacteria bacterium RBG_19FT_COMBO_42_6]